MSVYPKHHDPRKVFTMHVAGPMDISGYQWVHNIQDNCISMEWTDWLTNNCRSPWGWWFAEDRMCRVGFTDKSDMVTFAMMHQLD